MFGLGTSEVTATQRAPSEPQQTVFDLRDPVRAQNILNSKTSEIALNENSQRSAEAEAKAIDAEIEATEKINKTLDDPTVDLKISQLREQKKYALETADRNARIAASRKEALERWLEEGNPTNRELIDRNRALTKALR